MQNIKVLSLKNIAILILVLALVTIAIFSLDILMMLFGAFVITCAISPIINKMEKYIPRIWAVTLVLFVFILLCFLVLVPIITVSVKEAASIASNFPNVIDNIERFLNIKVFDKTISSLITFDSLKEPLTQGAQKLFENSISIGKWVANFLTTAFAVAIMVFYFAYDEKRLKDKFIEFFPKNQKEDALRIFDNIAQKVGNYLLAQGIAMVFVGALTTIGLILINNQHAFLLGFITCIFDIIPVVGPALAVACGLATSFAGGFGYIILTFAVYMLAQWAQNQFLRPIVFGKLLNMHPLIIIVALLISARFLGFWGVVLSPAIASVICVLVDELYLNRINEE